MRGGFFLTPYGGRSRCYTFSHYSVLVLELELQLDLDLDPPRVKEGRKEGKSRLRFGCMWSVGVTS